MSLYRNVWPEVKQPRVIHLACRAMKLGEVIERSASSAQESPSAHILIRHEVWSMPGGDSACDTWSQ